MGLRYNLPFRGPIRLTNYNFHAQVQFCITIYYHSCSIGKYRNMGDVKCHNFEILGISQIGTEEFCKTHSKSWEIFFHIPSIWADLRFPHALGLRYHLPYSKPIRMTNYNFHAHVQYCITFHYPGCSINKYRNVECPKCNNFGRLGISHFEKEGFCKTHP